MAEQVGTVELLKTRTYPIDPQAPQGGTTVIVEPGTFPVYRRMDAWFWVMTGQVNRRGFEKLGDGLFSMNAGDALSGIPATFPSLSFGPEQFLEFLGEPVCQPGPDQRLCFTFEPGSEPQAVSS